MHRHGVSPTSSMSASEASASTATGPAEDPGRAAGPLLHEWVFRHAAMAPDAPVISSATSRLTYRDLAERTLMAAGALRARGVGPGTRVVVALPNCPAMVVVSLAVQALGGAAVEVNRGWGAGPLRDILMRTDARHIVTWGRDARMWGDALDGLALDDVWVVHRDEPNRALLDALRRPAAWLTDDGRTTAEADVVSVDDLPAMDAGAVALILFTSGSTGTPQGVLQTHLMVGGSIHFDDRFAFPRTVMESIDREGCTGFAGVPLTFEILRRSVDLSSVPMSTLRYVTQAGGAMAPDTIRWARTAFAPAPVFVMYGQTEATARLTYLPPDRGDDKEGSIGIPVPGVEVRVLGEDGRERPPGEVGELVARGANVTPGYLDDPAATAAIIRDGWLWTGDLAERDADGFLFHRGRAREMIKVGGRRVSPVEIEQAIERHPAVAEAGVRGVTDSLKGEVPAAFVVRRTDAALSEAELRAYLRGAAAPWLMPSTITFVDRLPRNEAGKLLRAELPVPAETAVGTPVA
jgi:acyl-coenzyme A synthetase/AMP-(fatty) acid ligase